MDGHEGPVLEVAFSADNKILASCSGDKTIRLWESATETPITILKYHEAWVLSISWSADNLRLISSDVTGLILIWEIEKIIKNIS